MSLQNSSIANWNIIIDEHSKVFSKAFGSLSSSDLNWKPHERTWSIGQTIQHLIRTNESYYPIFDTLENGTLKLPFVARIKSLPRFLGKFILNAVEPSRKRKIKTFAVWTPDSSMVPGDIIAQFLAHHDKLKSVLKEKKGLFGHGLIISSPANKFIVYSVDDAMEIILTHEERHLNQALENSDPFEGKRNCFLISDVKSKKQRTSSGRRCSLFFVF